MKAPRIVAALAGLSLGLGVVVVAGDSTPDDNGEESFRTSTERIDGGVSEQSDDPAETVLRENDGPIDVAGEVGAAGRNPAGTAVDTGHSGDVSDPPATDPPATDPPATDPPATDPPATDPPATDPQVETVVVGCWPLLKRQFDAMSNFVPGGFNTVATRVKTGDVKGEFDFGYLVENYLGESLDEIVNRSEMPRLDIDRFLSVFFLERAVRELGLSSEQLGLMDFLVLSDDAPVQFQFLDTGSGSLRTIDVAIESSSCDPIRTEFGEISRATTEGIRFICRFEDLGVTSVGWLATLAEMEVSARQLSSTGLGSNAPPAPQFKEC